MFQVRTAIVPERSIRSAATFYPSTLRARFLLPRGVKIVADGGRARRRKFVSGWIYSVVGWIRSRVCASVSALLSENDARETIATLLPQSHRCRAVCGCRSADGLYYRHYESDVRLFEQFTEQTGIEVEVVKSKADALLERLKAEGASSPADVLMTSDAGRLHQAREAGVLQPIESALLVARIPENLRDPDGYWFGFQRARVLVYHPERVQAEELSSYENLAEQQWRAVSVARSSSNIYNQSLLASMLAYRGKAAAIDWASAVRNNMARAPQAVIGIRCVRLLRALQMWRWSTPIIWACWPTLRTPKIARLPRR